MMNSNYWSSEAFKLNPIVTTIGDAQLKWLETQLNHAKQKKQKVILAGHIPPGCSTYPGDRNMWLQNYTEAYINLTTTLYPDVVTAQLYGHTHSDKIKLQKGQSTKEAFLLICPSLTPNYQNNPAFRLFEYESEQQRLHDYTQFYFDLTVANVYRKSYWLKEYSFREEYQKTLSVDDVKSLVEDLSSASSPTWFKYSTHIKSQYNSVLFTQRFVEYCGAKNADYVSFVRCLKNYKNIGI